MMKHHVMIAVSAGVLIVASGSLAQTPSVRSAPAAYGSTSASAPASHSRPAVPKSVIDEMVKEATSQSPVKGVMVRHMEKVIELGEKAQKDYPDADLLGVRQLTMTAAQLLARHRDTDEGKKEAAQLLERTARQIVDSDAAPRDKAGPDAMLTYRRAVPDEGVPNPRLVEEEIRKYAQRYVGTNGEAQAVLNATMISSQARLDSLTGEFMALLQAKYIDSPGVLDMLRKMGQHPDIGRPFKAEMTRLDGSKLTLPQDLMGKVVVIQFWASWNGPCMTQMPQMRELYGKYKSQGLEIVGVSLDSRKSAIETLAQARGMTWTLTFSGDAWRDATAVACGISSIPTLWIVGRDGKVLADGVEQDKLQESVVKALAQPPPASEPR